MPDSHTDSDPSSLAQLLDIGSDEHSWPAAELTEILSLELSASLADELQKQLRDDAGPVQQWAQQATPPIVSISDLLQHPSPPVELLEALHRFSESHLRSNDSALPSPVAKLLTCTAMAATAAHLHRTSGEIDPRSARESLQWAARQTWTPQWLNNLCANGAEAISTDDASPGPPHDQYAPRLPGYSIEGRLGEGGMGVVWRAVQKATRRAVALKLIALAAVGSERARLRFDREVELASRLEHPNIARVYHSGSYHGLCYYAMELIEGAHLDDYVRQHNLSQKQILELFRTICDAIQHAHQRGVIHRDLKPSNILVTPDGQPHVVDFGLAKGLEQAEGDLRITHSGHHAGTPAFMSPEQAAGDSIHIDTRTDVYGLGAMLYLLIAGGTPHDASGPRYEALLRVGREEPRNPRRLNPSLDVEVECLLLKAVASQPDERYGSAADLSLDIWRYLTGRPLAARLPRPAYLARKWLARHRVGVAVAIGLAVLVIVSIRLDLYRVHRQRDLAESRGRDLAAVADLLRENVQVLRQREDQLRSQGRKTEIEVAQGLLSQADALGSAKMWDSAQRVYRDAKHRLNTLGLSERAADMGLSLAQSQDVIPVASFTFTDLENGIVLPCPDGRSAIALPETGAPRIVNILTGTSRAFSGVVAHVRAAAVSYDGSKLAAANSTGQIQLWDIESGTILYHINDQGGPSTDWIAFSGDSTCLLCSGSAAFLWRPAKHEQTTIQKRRGSLPALISSDGTRRIDMLISDEQLAGNATLTDEINQSYGAFSLSPTDRFIAMPLPDCSISICNVAAQKETLHLKGHLAEVTATAFSRNGVLLASLAADRTMRLWDARNGDPVQAYQLPKTAVPQYFWQNARIAFSEDRESVTCSLGNYVAVFAVANTNKRAAVFYRQADGISQLHFDATGRFAFFASDAQLVGLDVESGLSHVLHDLPVGFRLLGRTEHDLFYGTRGLSPNELSSDGWAFAAGRYGDVAVLDQTGSADALRINTGGQMVWGMALAQNGSQAAAVLSKGGSTTELTLRSWILPSINRPANDATPDKTCVLSVSNKNLLPSSVITYLPDSRHVLAFTNRTGVMWDSATGQVEAEIPMEQPSGVAVSSKGDFAVVISTTGQVCVQRFGRDSSRVVLGSHRAAATAVALSPDDRLAATCAIDHSLCIWDISEGRKVLSISDAADIPIAQCIAFSSKANALVVGGTDGTLWIWNFSHPTAREALIEQIAAARAAIARNPNDPAALITFGEWLTFRRLWARATEFFEQAREHGGTCSHLSLARCYWGMKRFSEARKEFAKALEAKEAPDDYLNLCLRCLNSPVTSN